MKKVILALAAFGLIAQANAQNFYGTANALPGVLSPSITLDPYFIPAGLFSEFDDDTFSDFSRVDSSTYFGVAGWDPATAFQHSLWAGSTVRITYLGTTAGAANSLGLVVGGTDVYGTGATASYSLAHNIKEGTAPAYGTNWSWTNNSQSSVSIDFWINNLDLVHGGTYSAFGTGAAWQNPDTSGTPLPYSARARWFFENDSESETWRTILVIAFEDWRVHNYDFTDVMFAVEFTSRDGTPQFPVPEPSTYGLIGAMMLLGLVAVRRARRS